VAADAAAAAAAHDNPVTRQLAVVLDLPEPQTWVHKGV
jgi:hypothetical protein